MGTRKVTPTKRGFRVLKDVSASIAKELTAMEKKRKRPTITYDLTVSFKGREPKKLRGVGLRRLRDVKQKRGEKKKARSRVIAESIEKQIRAKVFEAIREEFPDTDSPQLKVKLRKWARKKVAATLREFKKKRGAGFQVQFYRET